MSSVEIAPRDTALWINEVVPDGELGAAVDRWLAEIHGLCPSRLELAKLQMTVGKGPVHEVLP
ncbi:hypothetical protein Acor_68370 [Acrocarpospora corrugata]|uniref:Uncharacterized protein n=1 Tax=Acrocarpospora corrugata TaxID=35763 RepID=A0A5M3W8W7_9ACTN|nr:hypothetical protein [Acrocarpospora corrugata]GES04769.1 hypothetical protein Acor_68370 [Acrocarpospora corrugata]